MPGKNRAKAMAEKRARKAKRMSKPGAASRYAKKRNWLNSNRWTEADDGGPTRRCFGFEVPEPKPWK